MYLWDGEGMYSRNWSSFPPLDAARASSCMWSSLRRQQQVPEKVTNIFGVGVASQPRTAAFLLELFASLDSGLLLSCSSYSPH
ncbi:uncharacterized protein LOC144768755 isoform X2 [Lissotriton helveticus]